MLPFLAAKDCPQRGREEGSSVRAAAKSGNGGSGSSSERKRERNRCDVIMTTRATSRPSSASAGRIATGPGRQRTREIMADTKLTAGHGRVRPDETPAGCFPSRIVIAVTSARDWRWIRGFAILPSKIEDASSLVESILKRDDAITISYNIVQHDNKYDK